MDQKVFVFVDEIQYLKLLVVLEAHLEWPEKRGYGVVGDVDSYGA
jgi:hypothetical protein